MNPRYPVFIPTKGRWESRLTIRALEKIGVPYTAFIEAQEYEQYAAVVNPANLHVMPHRDQGLVVTRNYIWDYAQHELKTPRFWTMDDNIKNFFRLNNNLKVPVTSGNMLCAIEDFVERYENVPIAGMNYFMFASRKTKMNPITLNTRVYSNMLIQTDATDPRGKPYRNEGFYNDDTDLCLRVLKDGLCTILFNAFLIEKSVTMTVKGGMTPHYQGDGRYKMAEELRKKHPDVTTITYKWGRWQHQVDYRPFKNNRLIRIMATKADKLTVEQRVEAVYRLILDGWTQEQIFKMSKSFRVSDRQVYATLDKAWERIEAVAAPELSEHHRRAVAAHYQMLREAKTVKEKATVWAALSRLLGLDAPKVVELGGKDGEPIPFRMVDYRAGLTDTEG
jgi:hypothetical protein